MSTEQNWYRIDNVDALDSPCLVVYRSRVVNNINALIQSIGDVSRLRPHVKTHKSAEVTGLLLEAGITKFKCATIAEAEMLAGAGAKDILLAYQPVGPKATRFASLQEGFNEARFSCLIDNAVAAQNVAAASRGVVRAFIDLNIGMNRTGITPDAALELYLKCNSIANLEIVGLHAYDGHIRDKDFNTRKQRCDAAFERVAALAAAIEAHDGKHMTIVAGGTPTYSVHRLRRNVECSPGTFIYWDKGYESILREQQYQHAAVVLTRVISKPTPDSICVDLGHKSIASENPLTDRVIFLNEHGLVPLGHSEEHMVLTGGNASKLKIGDVLYGVPFHVCPTVALYDTVKIVEDHQARDTWKTLSRNRMISV